MHFNKVGPESPRAAKLLNAGFLRSQYGVDSLRNAFYASDSVDIAQLDVGNHYVDNSYID